MESRRLKRVHSEVFISDRNGASVWQDTIYRPFNPPTLDQAVIDTATLVAEHLERTIQEPAGGKRQSIGRDFFEIFGGGSETACPAGLPNFHHGQIDDILQNPSRMRGRDPEAWKAFLADYTPMALQFSAFTRLGRTMSAWIPGAIPMRFERQ